MKTPLILALAVIVIFVVTCTALVWHSGRGYRDDQRWVTHTHQVLEAIGAVLARVRDAESSVRGYIASGDEAFLKIYQNEREAILRSDDGLRPLVSDNPAQVGRVDRLKAALQQRVDRFDELIRVRRTTGLAEAAAGLTPGRLWSEKTRSILVEMEEEERRLLEIRNAESDRSLVRTMVYFGLMSTAAIGVLGALFVVAQRSSSARVRVQRELDQFFTTSLDLLGVADLSTGCFTRINPSWERTLGWTREEVLGKPWNSFVHPDDLAETNRQAQGLGRGEAVVSFENRYRCKDGSYRWLSWKVPAPAPGSPLLFCVARDVTGARRQEEEIRALNASLKERVDEALAANKELEAFSYSVSHDLRAPLRGIDGFSRILVEDYATVLGEEGLRLLTKVCENSRQMGVLIDDLLQYSRLGRKEVETTLVDMEALARDAVEEVRKDKPGIAAEVILGRLPSVQGDRALLRQAWVNLVSNAFKYSAKKPGARIEIAGDNGGSEAVFHVRDNGVGFDMKYVDKLFGVFQRLHSAREFEGTGVGLAIVQRVIQRHGGRIWAEGKPDEGAAFHFAIPVRKERT